MFFSSLSGFDRLELGDNRYFCVWMPWEGGMGALGGIRALFLFVLFRAEREQGRRATVAHVRFDGFEKR